MNIFNSFNNYLKNNFAKYFVDNRPEQQEKIQSQVAQNSQGISEIEMQLGNSKLFNPYGIGGVIQTNVEWERIFHTKVERILTYRSMSFFPEICDALDMITDDAIIQNAEGNVVQLNFKKEVPRHIEEIIKTQWDYLINDVFNFNDIGWELFRKWLIDSELYVELVLNDEGTNIIGIKVLSPLTMSPVYEENRITGYVQNISNISNVSISSNVTAMLEFDKDQVVYSNYGFYHEGMDVRGYLESAIRTYNQLKNLEDSVVIYRVTRASEKRIWNIAVGKMPKGKAEEYIKGLIQRYKKRIIYDPESGAMNTTQNIQAITEDFWFSKNEQGEGTTIETIGSGMNLGELDDVNYFKKKLFQTLKLPRSRWDDSAGVNYSSGKNGDMAREELKFQNFIERLQKRFSYILMSSFLTLLKFNGVDEKYIDDSLYSIKFTTSNLLKEYKEMELNESRMSLLMSCQQFMYDKEVTPNGIFAPEFILKDILMFSDEMLQKNNDLLQKLKNNQETKEGETGQDINNLGMDIGGGSGDLGGESVPETPEENSETETTPEETTTTSPELEGQAGRELTSPVTNAPEAFSPEISDENNFGGLFQAWLNDDRELQNSLKKKDGFHTKDNFTI